MTPELILTTVAVFGAEPRREVAIRRGVGFRGRAGCRDVVRRLRLGLRRALDLAAVAGDEAVGLEAAAH